MEKNKTIPERVREHLGSALIINTIENLGVKTGIPFPSLLPAIVFDLVSGRIDPAILKDSIKEQIKLSDKKINTIAFEIKEKILRPIQNDLKNIGVDIENIETTDALTLGEFIKKENDFLRSIGEEPEFDENEISLEPEEPKNESISLEIFAPDVKETSREDSIKITRDDSKKVSDTSPAPFMLHREKPVTGTSFPEKKQTSQSSSKSFSLPFGFFKPKGAQAPTGPIRVKVELPGGSVGKEEKTIHYSDLRTPVIPFQKEESFIETNGNEKPVKIIAPESTENTPDKRPKAPIDILQKKEPEHINLQETQQTKRVAVKNSIMSIPSIVPKEEPKKTVIPEPEEIKISPEKAKKTSPEEKPALTGMGFFWKSKPKDKTPKDKETGPEITGNKIDLRQ